MTPADQYRERAAAADAMAARTPDATLKQGFIDLARQWRALADQAEARTLGRKPPED